MANKASQSIKSSQSNNSSQKKKKPVSKPNVLKFDVLPSSSTKRINPLTAFSSQPVFNIEVEVPTPTQSQSNVAKGKGKAKAQPQISRQGAPDGALWVDMYEPGTEAELAVHSRKVEEVRRWLTEAFEGGPSGKLRKYRRILALTGPAGAAKTTTLRVLSREMGFDITEWHNSFEDQYPTDGDDDSYESLFTKFQNFMSRATTCSNSLFSTKSSKRQVVLLEDLPNILHQQTQSRFHTVLESLVELPQSTPIVLIISDAGLRGEGNDDAGGWRNRDGVVDIRTAFSKSLLNGPYVTQIGFNPIAPTLMRKALQAMINAHFSSSSSSYSGVKPPSKEALDVIIESVNGDIRSAVMALQFACSVSIPEDTKGKGRAKKSSRGMSTRVLMELVTKRENSLALFHLLGKVLYNKRKGDPSNASASAKDIQRERELDAKLKDPIKLPSFLREHERATSRVDVDMLYADSPIDSSLFSLYIHQNYTQFCDDVDQCADISEWLSWVDSSGGEAWYQANPHRFHLLALGTLHSLPSPVERKSQKFYKPEFFEQLNKEREAGYGIKDVQGWLIEEQSTTVLNKATIATELGAVLKAISSGRAPPASHKLFTHMPFELNGGRSQLLQEGEIISEENDVDGREGYPSRSQGDYGASGEEEEDVNGGWLENDDIEEF